MTSGLETERLVSMLDKSFTYLLIHLPTYLQPQNHTGRIINLMNE